MEFQFAHLTDYAGEDRSGKLILAGIFDNIMADARRPIVLPPFFLVVQFTAHVTEGTEHHLEMRLTDADGKDVAPRVPIPLKFIPTGPRLPLRARVIATLGGLAVADVGEFAFHFFVNNRRLGELPLHVIAAPPKE